MGDAVEKIELLEVRVDKRLIAAEEWNAHLHLVQREASYDDLVSVTTSDPRSPPRKERGPARVHRK